MAQAPVIKEKKLLVAKDLAKVFGTLKAVESVSLDIAEGECLALLGPNGAGKTTTCEMLEGLIAPDAGSIEIMGMDLAKKRSEILQEIGIQLQETILYQKYTVRETLELFASFYSRSVDLLSLIASLGLQEKANVRLEKLSGGQKQRVNLGCALVNNPRLVFFDEPTTGLDPQARRNIWDMIRDIKKEGRSILLTTHYMEEAEKLADRVAIMDRGRIISQGTPRELIEKHGSAQILWFSLAGDKDSEQQQQLDLLKKELPWLGTTLAVENGYEIATSSAADHLQELVRASDRLKIGLQSLQMRQSTLEDVFLKLTGRSFKDA